MSNQIHPSKMLFIRFTMSGREVEVAQPISKVKELIANGQFIDRIAKPLIACLEAIEV